MKNYLYICLIGVAVIFTACGGGKSNDPAPVDNNTGATGSTGNTGSTGGTGGNTGPTITHININTAGGNGAFDTKDQLTSISLGDANIGSSFSTTAITANDVNPKLLKTSLEHFQDAVFDKTLGQWRAAFPKYNAADTNSMPYIRAISTDASKNITEYRAYLAGKTAYLYWYGNVAATMDVQTYTKAFASLNTQKVTNAVVGK